METSLAAPQPAWSQKLLIRHCKMYRRANCSANVSLQFGSSLESRLGAQALVNEDDTVLIQDHFRWVIQARAFQFHAVFGKKITNKNAFQ